MSPEREICEARARLLAAGAALRMRSLEDRLRVLGALLEALRDPGAAIRSEWETALAGTTGFDAANLRSGLDLALASWDSAALEALAAREIGAARSAGAPKAPTSRVSGFETTSVLLGGALPTPTVSALVFPLVLGSPVLARPSRHDPQTARIVERALDAIDPAFAKAIEIVDFDVRDEVLLRAFLDAPCVVATGSDATIASLAAKVGPPRRFVAHAHRISIGVVGPEAFRRGSLGEIARGLALDVALWDQLGCLSPLAVFVVAGTNAAATADDFARALDEALHEIERELPRGCVPIEAEAAIARARSDAELRKAAGLDVSSHAGATHTVVREADSRPREAPLHRFVRVHPVRDEAALRDAIAPLGPHLAGVAVAGFGVLREAVAGIVLDAGASRVCAPGRLQAPPLAWHHDGRAPLLSLARVGDLE